MTPQIAAEITLQPVKRFDFDAAIIFSDILVVPHALGQVVQFVDGVGPRLNPLDGIQALDQQQKHWTEKLAPVYEALQITQKAITQPKALIGFAGGPWTLASYMLEGGGSKDQQAAKTMLGRERRQFGALIDLLCEIVTWHLARQLEAGADVVQIFDSHAGSLAGQGFVDWVVTPTKRIVKKLREEHPRALVIGFPRGVAAPDYEHYAMETGVHAVSLDTAVDLDWAVPALGGRVTLQGNLDPVVLVAGGAALDEAVDRIVAVSRGAPFIFNLGHGVLPETPLTHVERMIARVRARA